MIREGDDLEDPNAHLERNPATGRDAVPGDHPSKQ